MSGIIKRRRKRFFAIVPNHVLEDRRLSAEARGVLAYLLSRPHDWETRLTHLRGEFGCGKERIERIMREIIEAGYVARVRTRADGGAFDGYDYTVNDDPVGAAADGEAASAEDGVAFPPQSGFPPVVDAVGGFTVGGKTVGGFPAHGLSNDSTKDGKDQEAERERAGEEGKPGAAEEEHPTAAEALAALKVIWPDIALENVDLALSALSTLSASERQDSIRRVPDFLAFHRAKRGSARLPYLFNYLKQKRWVDLPDKGAPGGPDAAAAARALYVDAFSRPWWLLVHRFLDKHRDALTDVRSGPSLTLRRIFDNARYRSIGHTMADAGKREEIAKAAEVELVPVRKTDSAVVTWVRGISQGGVSVPLPDQVDWIFMPPALLDELAKQGAVSAP